MFNSSKGLGKYISQLIVGGNMMKSEEPLLKLVPDKVAIDFNVFSTIMKHMILSYVYS